MEELMQEIEKWSEKYQFSFQFWGAGNNNCFLYKDEVEISSFGGDESIEDILKRTLSYIYRINRTPHKDRVFHS